MSSMEQEKSAIKHGVNADTQELTNIRDTIPEKLLKVYIYKAKDYDRQTPSFVAGGVSNIHITIDNMQDHWDYVLDENNQPYIEVFGAIDYGTGQSVVSKKSLSTSMNTTIALTGLCDSHKFDEKDDNPPIYYYTLHEPYDYNKYIKGDQKVFTGAMNGTNEDDYQWMDENVIKLGGNPTKIELVSLQVIEAEKKARAIFHVMSESFNPLTNPNGHNGYGFNITLDSSGGKLSRRPFVVKGVFKDKQSGNMETKSLHITTKTKFVPVKETITDADYELEVNVDSMDPNVHTPLYLINKFKNPTDIKEIFSKGNGKYYEEEYVCLLDMLTVSHAINTEFIEFPRIVSGTQGATSVDPSIRLTSKGRPISSFTSKRAKAVDAIYVDYISRVRPDDDSIQLKLLKLAIGALSPYLISSKSIAQGKDNYSKLYLLWYLEPTESITLKSKKVKNRDYGSTGDEVDTFVLESLRVKFSSRLLDATPSKDIKLKDEEVSLSTSTRVNVNRNVGYPTLPRVIKSSDTIKDVGMLDSSSDKDLEYQLFTTIEGTDDNLNKLYLSDPNATEKKGSADYVVTTDWKTPTDLYTGYIGARLGRAIFGKNGELTDAEWLDVIVAIILRDIKKLYPIKSGTDVTLITPKTQLDSFKETRDGPITNWQPIDVFDTYPSDSDIIYGPMMKIRKDWLSDDILEKYIEIFFQEASKNHIEPGTLMKRDLDDDEIISMLAGTLGVLDESIKLTKVHSRKITAIHYGYLSGDKSSFRRKIDMYVQIKVDYVLQDVRWHNITVNMDLDKGIVGLNDIQSTYNKSQWQNKIKQIGILNKSFDIPVDIKQIVDDNKDLTISEIEYSGFWNDEIIITIGGYEYRIPLFNADEETIGSQTILFV